jgi:hypothetical protein
MVKKYDPTDPTQRIEDWAPARPTQVLEGTLSTKGPESNETKLLSDLDEPGLDGENPAAQKGAGGDVNFMHDPVVGWLVVVKGPGRGASRRLSQGQNSVGRGPGNNIRLDFGDKRISREEHCIVTFEPRARKFYVQNAGGRNLTYLNDTVVLQPDELLPGSTITVGDTNLRFVPFCNEDFGWDTAPE